MMAFPATGPDLPGPRLPPDNIADEWMERILETPGMLEDFTVFLLIVFFLETRNMEPETRL